MKKEELKNKYGLNELKTLEEAIKILPEVSTSKFVGTVDINVQINLKDKNKKDSVKGSVTFPNQFGGDKKVVVICDEKDAAKAKKAGAVEAGLDEVVEKIEKGQVEFDVVVATPSVMPKIVKLGKVLGPKGLMPNPKNGTITDDPATAVESFKAGKHNFKMEQGQGVIRSKVAKLDMKPEQLTDNITTFLKSVLTETRKYGVNPFKQVLLKPTMGPSIKVDTNDIIAMLK